MKITFFQRLQGWGLSAYSGVVWRTVRYQVQGKEHLERVRTSGRPLIVASWHGMTMMAVGYLHLFGGLRQYVPIVPEDPRGASLSVWIRHLGAHPYPISMQEDSLVAGRRLLALIRQMQQGKSIFLNPDGPYGPSHEPKAGVVFIARKTGALIVPAGAFTAFGYRIPRWDRYTVPFPFSRVSLVFGEPLEVAPGAERKQARMAVRQRLDEVERAAEALYRRPLSSSA